MGYSECPSDADSLTERLQLLPLKSRYLHCSCYLENSFFPLEWHISAWSLPHPCCHSSLRLRSSDWCLLIFVSPQTERTV